MSKLQDSFDLHLSQDSAMMACKQAVVACGWAVGEMDDRRIVPKIGVGLTRNPSKIEIVVNPVNEQQTSVALNGKIYGVGPIQKSRLTGLMNELRNAIEVAAQGMAI